LYRYPTSGSMFLSTDFNRTSFTFYGTADNFNAEYLTGEKAYSRCSSLFDNVMYDKTLITASSTVTFSSFFSSKKSWFEANNQNLGDTLCNCSLFAMAKYEKVNYKGIVRNGLGVSEDDKSVMYPNYYKGFIFSYYTDEKTKKITASIPAFSVLVPNKTSLKYTLNYCSIFESSNIPVCNNSANNHEYPSFYYMLDSLKNDQLKELISYNTGPIKLYDGIFILGTRSIFYAPTDSENIFFNCSNYTVNQNDNEEAKVIDFSGDTLYSCGTTPSAGNYSSKKAAVLCLEPQVYKANQ